MIPRAENSLIELDYNHLGIAPSPASALFINEYHARRFGGIGRADDDFSAGQYGVVAVENVGTALPRRQRTRLCPGAARAFKQIYLIQLRKGNRNGGSGDVQPFGLSKNWRIRNRCDIGPVSAGVPENRGKVSRRCGIPYNGVPFDGDGSEQQLPRQ